MFIEVKRDDPRSWEEWKADADHIEYMHIGVADDRAAAQYVRGGFRCPDPIVYATANPAPSPDDARVPYDEVLGWCFPAETVVSLDEVRQLMIDFAVRGEWSGAVPWQVHDHLVA